MKKNTFILLCAAALTCSAGLSSCLGESESKLTADEFTYIVNDDVYGVYALAPQLLSYGYLITSPEIKNEHPGDIVKISYSVDLTQSTTTNLLTATSCTVYPDERYSESRQILMKTGAPNPLATTDIDSAFTSKPLPVWGSSTELLNDKWIFQYKCRLVQDQPVTLEIFYNPDRQVDTENDSVGDADVILDVRLRKGNAGSSDETPVETTKRVMLNFSSLRPILFDKKEELGLGSQEYLDFRVRLRAYIEDDDVIVENDRLGDGAVFTMRVYKE